jgi:hypothetical protein
VVGEEISALPVIGQLDAIESVVGQGSRDLLEVEQFLLSGIEALDSNLFETRAGLRHGC